MKKIFLIFLVLFPFLPSSAQETGGDVDGLHTDKVAEYKDGIGTITLDTFVEGEVKVVSISAPADIVLVLDMSGSMTDSFSGSDSRLTALKSAVCSFIENIAEKAVDFDVNHKIGICSFNDYEEYAYGTKDGTKTISDLTPAKSKDADGEYTLVNKVNSLTDRDASGATMSNKGMERAESILNSRTETTYQDPISHQNYQRPTFVIFFSDGFPGTGEDSKGFSDAVLNIKTADETLVVSDRLKANNTKIFSIGIHKLCNPSGEINFSEEYSYTPPSTYYDPKDNAMNSFMHLVSSNYGVTNKMIGHKDDKRSDIKETYYFSCSDASVLDRIFTHISTTIIEETAAIDLGTETVLKDYIDNSTFVLPEGTKAEDIKVYARKFIGMDGDTYVFESDATKYVYPVNNVLTIDGKIYTITIDLTQKDSNGNQGVTVSGFNYSEQFVGFDTTTDPPTPHGYELEVLIPFTFKNEEDVVEGTYQTNTDESGIYDEEGNIVKPYPVPSIHLWDLTIIRQNLELGESAVYDVYEANGPEDYTAGKLKFRVVLTGTTIDGTEPVSKTIAGVTARTTDKDGNVIEYYYRVQETGWNWAYALEQEKPLIQTYASPEHLVFTFTGEHKSPSSSTDPLNKLLHTEVYTSRAVEYSNVLPTN